MEREKRKTYRRFLGAIFFGPSLAIQTTPHQRDTCFDIEKWQKTVENIFQVASFFRPCIHALMELTDWDGKSTLTA